MAVPYRRVEFHTAQFRLWWNLLSRIIWFYPYFISHFIPNCTMRTAHKNIDDFTSSHRFRPRTVLDTLHNDDCPLFNAAMNLLYLDDINFSQSLVFAQSHRWIVTKTAIIKFIKYRDKIVLVKQAGKYTHSHIFNCICEWITFTTWQRCYMKPINIAHGLN